MDRVNLAQESLYVYAQILVTNSIREELSPVRLSKTIEQFPASSYKEDVMQGLFNKIIGNLLIKFQGDSKIIADCKKENTTPEKLTNNYNMCVIKAVEQSFNKWQSEHSETQFKSILLNDLSQGPTEESCCIL